MKSKKSLLALAIPFLAALAGIIVFQLQSATVEKDQRAQFIKGGGFSLSNEGSPFQLADLKGSPVILYFGFTHCPDVCPVGLSVISEVFKSKPKFDEARALFVTLDPERDNGSKLSEYVSFFHQNIIGLTGKLDEIEVVAKKYATYFKKVPLPDSELEYTVDHTAYFFLIDRNGELIRVLDHNTDAKKLGDEFSKLI